MLLGGSWVLRSRVISRGTMVLNLFRVLITLLISAHEPRSRDSRGKRRLG